ncbi:MobF family relaxase [Reichenbachiella sp.]|uniref:MobF family relaxase n=1 Tax=Reichenbachiella sp. TaxID=2184521 RepID=UPI003299F57D
MLTTNISRDVQACMEYYQQGLSLDDYYRNDQVKAFYNGKLAERLGLKDVEVTKENFSSLLHGIDPKSGERLRIRDIQNPRVGFDFTVNANKSISLIYSITKDPAILSALHHANTQMMKEIESYAQYQQSSETQRFYKYSKEILFSSYFHRNSRPTEFKDKNGKTIYAPDPHLHIHNFINAHTWNEDKKRFQALELGDAVYRRLPYFEKVFHSHLSHQIRMAGYQIERSENGFFELTGLSRATLEKFSNRTRAIEKFAKKNNITDPKIKGELGAKLRNSKTKTTIKEKELYDHWMSRLSPEELRAIHTLKGRTFERPKPLSLKDCVDKAISHHLEREAAAPTERIIATALTYGYGLYIPEDIRREINSRGTILQHEIEGMTYMTTEQMRLSEEKLITLATNGKGKYPALNPHYEPKDWFNNQQRNAVKTILSSASTDRTTILRGRAGVGKSTSLKAIAEGAALAGKSTYAASPTTQAAKLLSDDGFEATTVAALLHSQKLQERLRGQVLLLDEAGQCPLKDMSKVLSLSEKLDFRCVLSGDTRQHSPIGQDALSVLENQSKVESVTINQIMRQKSEAYKSAIQKLAVGRTREGFNDLDKKMNAIKEIPDHDKRINQIADDYIGSISKGRSAMIVSPTNFERSQISEVVRQKLKEKKQIKGKERILDQLINLSYTQSQKQDLVNYSENMVVKFSKNQKGGFKSGSHWEVLPLKKHGEVSVRNLKTGQVSKLPLENTKHLDVFSKAKAPLAKGDLIRLTQNIRTQGTKLNNGNHYTVKQLSKNGILLDNNKIIPNDTYHWTHGHVSTSHSAQSQTKDDVFISMSDRSFAAVNEQTLYVAASRGKYNASIYTSNKDDLKRAVVRSGTRVSAREVAEGHERRLLQQKQQAHHRAMNEKTKENERLQQREKTTSRGISKELSRH